MPLKLTIDTLSFSKRPCGCAHLSCVGGVGRQLPDGLGSGLGASPGSRTYYLGALQASHLPRLPHL